MKKPKDSPDNQDVKINDKSVSNYLIRDEQSECINKIMQKELNDINKRRQFFKRRKPATSSQPETTNGKNRQKDKVNDLVGLSLSGGGIRSATFNLGLLQVLSSFKLIEKVDYLSTVSGGGYVGSCFTSLLNSDLKRYAENDSKFDPEKDSLIDHKYFPFSLKEEGSYNTLDKEKASSKWLRYFSNYLTSEGGLTKYFRPIMIFTKGIILNAILVAPYLLLAAFLLTMIFHFSIFFGSGAYLIDNWFFSLPYFANLAQTNTPPEWLVIFKIPLILFGFIIFYAIIVQRYFNKKYRNRIKNNGLLASLLLVATLIIALQLFGLSIAYWDQINLYIVSIFPPLLGILKSRQIILGGNTKNDQSKTQISKLIISIILMAFVPLLLLFGIGAAIKFFSSEFFVLSGASLESVNLNNIFFYLTAFLVVWLLSEVLININDISPHKFYRDRLSKAYLIRDVYNEKDPQPFSKVSHFENQKLSKLYCDDSSNIGPYHIINTTLNLTPKMPPTLTSQQDSIKEAKNKSSEAISNTGIFRSGESFIFSKYWCGSGETGYIDTKVYEDNIDPHIDLGTAIAISGAAANIGMAQKNISGLRLIMALLNIRLGYWITNPAECARISESNSWLNKILPPFPSGWHSAVKEWMNNYKPGDKYVNLSDGGHFDNIGVYELLKRECKYIIVSDAEADPKMKFQALAYIIRLARIDLGIIIDIDVSDIKPDAETGYSKNHCAVGIINYSKNNIGYLFYLKSSLTGNEPEHLYEYKVDNPTFPHQTTADQWFDEQQFEVYRELGYHVGKEAFEIIRNDQGSSLEDEFVKLKHHWYPQCDLVEKHFTQHTAELNNIFNEFKNDNDLMFMDAQVYPGFSKLYDETTPESQKNFWIPKDSIQMRKAFYQCNKMIQLMENVYTDLDLEIHFEHPDNKGWMNLFLHWSQSNMFKIVWSNCAATYGSRFQSFAERKFRLSIGELFCETFELTNSEFFNAKGESDENKFVELHNNDILNPIEIKRIKNIVLKEGIQFDKLYRFFLVVNNALDVKKEEATAELKFPFAFALMDMNNDLVFFRVQDHLRDMGLGRKSLKYLVVHYNLRNLSPKAVEVLGKKDYYKLTLNATDKFIKSIRTELYNHI